VALAILRDPDAAVDVTHDTFARAFDRWHQYDANRPLRAWLHGIVRHRALGACLRGIVSSAALDSLRRRRVRAFAVPALGRVREARGSDTLEDDPGRHLADRDEVADALAGLKPDARAALVLRHYYRYDYAEIGRYLRTSPGNVGSIPRRGHAHLRGPPAPPGAQPR